MAIIRSILDNDLYKFTMQNAVLKYRQGIPVEYRFKNRSPNGKFNIKFYDAFCRELENIEKLYLLESELNWLKWKYPIFGDDYFSYLYNYRYNSNEVSFSVHDELELSINGSWEHTILWEVPLMALISELYFTHCEPDWSFAHYAAQHSKKVKALSDYVWCDFGTRRRRGYAHQDLVVHDSYNHLLRPTGFTGTSNVHLAHKHGVNAIGTMAHEWIMGVSALEGLQHANRHALRIWSDIYRGNFGIALTDTFGTDVFLKDFDSYFARLYDGVRHDSGDPIEFGEKIIDHYRKLGIDPTSKMIVFSDGLTPSVAVKIAEHFAGSIKVSFGIGTNLTNDYTNPLNMVIKLHSCNNVPVVKFSDVYTKQSGDLQALNVARWVFGSQFQERMLFGKEGGVMDIKVFKDRTGCWHADPIKLSGTPFNGIGRTVDEAIEDLNRKLTID